MGAPPADAGADVHVLKEAEVDQSWLCMVVGTIVIVIAAAGVAAHYRRERQRARLLRKLDGYDWCQWTRSRR